MSIITQPERLARMLVDCHDSIYAAYHYTQPAIDQLERPCWLIFVEDASFQNSGVDQEQYEQGYSIAYVGQVFNGVADSDLLLEYEVLAREVAVDSVKYLFERQQLQCSNVRGLFVDEFNDPIEYPALDNVLWMRVDGRGPVTLYSRDAVEGETFWGFTIDITVTTVMEYETVP